jgi:hypothetical protein
MKGVAGIRDVPHISLDEPDLISSPHKDGTIAKKINSGGQPL